MAHIGCEWVALVSGNMEICQNLRFAKPWRLFNFDCHTQSQESGRISAPIGCLWPPSHAAREWQGRPQQQAPSASAASWQQPGGTPTKKASVPQNDGLSYLTSNYLAKCSLAFVGTWVSYQDFYCVPMSLSKLPTDIARRMDMLTEPCVSCCHWQGRVAFLVSFEKANYSPPSHPSSQPSLSTHPPGPLTMVFNEGPPVRFYAARWFADLNPWLL